MPSTKPKARIVLTDGQTFELASDVAIRPAALHFKDAKGAERVVEVNAVQQVSFAVQQVLAAKKGEALTAVAVDDYDPKAHGPVKERRTVLRAPEEGDIAKLPLHPKR